MFSWNSTTNSLLVVRIFFSGYYLDLSISQTAEVLFTLPVSSTSAAHWHCKRCVSHSVLLSDNILTSHNMMDLLFIDGSAYSGHHDFSTGLCYCKVTSVVSDSVWPHRRQPTRLPHPWDSPGKNTGVGCHFLLQCMKVKSESEVAQSCPTLSDPMDCSPPGSSVHGIFQARALEWAAIAFSLLGSSME